MAFCCSNKESLDGMDFIETYNKIIVDASNGHKGLKAAGGGRDSFNPKQSLSNIPSAQVPVPVDNQGFSRLTKGDLSNFAQRQIRKSKYGDLLEQYKGKVESWTDPDFPPTSKSWGISTDKVTWKRVKDVIKDPEFVSDNFTPSDILQGRLGNCYFLSAIAGIAEKPHRIKRLFPNTQLNDNGIYMARVLFKGVYQEVVVDDFFPCSPQGNLLGAQPAGKK